MLMSRRSIRSSSKVRFAVKSGSCFGFTNIWLHKIKWLVSDWTLQFGVLQKEVMKILPFSKKCVSPFEI